jgi:hypothetical protein
LNPRPPGYEPYDARLWRLGLSLAGVVTSADRTDHISLRRLRLVLSRHVRFTNRFTEQAIDLQFPAPFPLFRGCHPWVRGTVSGFAKRLPSGMALTCATHRLRSYPTPGPRRPGRHHHRPACTGAPTAPLPSPDPSPEPDCCRTLRQTGSVQGRRNRSRSDAAGALDRFPASVNTPTAGSGRPPTIPPAYLLPPARFHKLHYQLGKLSGSAFHVA